MKKNNLKTIEKSRFGRFISNHKVLGNLSYTAQRDAGMTALKGCILYNLKSV